MVSYGYTLDHIAPERTDAPPRTVKPCPHTVCAAVILGASAALWICLVEVVSRLVL